MNRLDALGQWTRGGGALRKLKAARRGGVAIAEEQAPGGPTDPEANPDRNAGPANFEAEVGANGRALWIDDDDENRVPGESVGVYGTVDLSINHQTGDRWLTIHHRFAGETANRICAMVIAQGALWQEAAALAYLRQGAHDVRPALLLLLHAEDFDRVPECLAYGRRYLRAWSEREGLRLDEAVLQCAAETALQWLFDGRDVRRSRKPGAKTNQARRPQLSALAKSCGVRLETFGLLRRVAVMAYARRLQEAEERFVEIADYVAPRTGSDALGTMAETWWRPWKRLGILSPRRFLQSHIGTSSLSRSHDPRVPSRDTDGNYSSRAA